MAHKDPGTGGWRTRSLGPGGTGLLFLLLGGFVLAISEPGDTSNRYNIPAQWLGWSGVAFGAVLLVVACVRRAGRRSRG